MKELESERIFQLLVLSLDGYKWLDLSQAKEETKTCSWSPTGWQGH